jgi:protocatechuate 3,4-dioxygenase beta subunit
MRMKLITSLVLLLCVSLISFVLWLEITEPKARERKHSNHSITHADDQALMPSPQLAPTRPRDKADLVELLNGVVVDGNTDTVSNSSILYRVAPASPKHDCLAPNDILDERNDDTYLVNSDEQGEFSIPLVSPASDGTENYCLVINVSKPSFTSTTVASLLNMQNLPGLIDIELHRNITIYGAVEDPNGKSMAGATVIVWASDTESAVEDVNHCVSAIAEPIGTSVTEADGSFQLDTVNEINFCIQAFDENWGSSLPLVFTEQDVSQLLQLELRENIRLTGRVLDPLGYPVQSISTRFDGKLFGKQSKSYVAISNEQGDFTIDQLDYDQYQLQVTNPNYNIFAPEFFSYQPESQESDLVITVFPHTTISGKVSDDTGRGVAGVAISARSPYTLEKTTSTVSSDANGDFQLISLHQSNSAYDSAKVATAFVQGTEPDSVYASADSVCIDFVHPKYQTRTVALSTTNSELELGDIFMAPSIIQLSGLVVDYQGNPIKAKLIFENSAAIESDPKNWQARLPNCDDSSIEIAVNTDTNGYFTVNIDKPSIYDIQVVTEKYKPRQVQLEVTQSKDDVVIKLK